MDHESATLVAGLDGGMNVENLLRFIVRHLVSDPSCVTVSSREERGSTVFELSVATEDAGRVIGRAGVTINAIRTIAQMAGSREHKKVWVELKEGSDKARAEVGDKE